MFVSVCVSGTCVVLICFDLYVVVYSFFYVGSVVSSLVFVFYYFIFFFFFFFFSSRRRHTRWTGDWSSDVCSSDLNIGMLQTSFGDLKRQGHSGASVHYLPFQNPSRYADSYVQKPKLLLHRRVRSEERRVGKECRSQWSTDHEKKNRREVKRKEKT